MAGMSILPLGHHSSYSIVVMVNEPPATIRPEMAYHVLLMRPLTTSLPHSTFRSVRNGLEAVWRSLARLSAAPVQKQLGGNRRTFGTLDPRVSALEDSGSFTKCQGSSTGLPSKIIL
eukprot:s162_g13.t1